MTQEEADKIAAVLRTADSGCSTCVRDLCERATAARLGFRFEMTGQTVEVREQPDWTDDPEEARDRHHPEVVARPEA